MRLRLITAPALSGACFLLVGCSVEARHTSDAKLERNFLDHQAEFGALLTKLQADTGLTMISTRAVYYRGHLISTADDFVQAERAGLTKEHWAEYQRHLVDLGLVQIGKSDSGIEFRVDQGSMFNGDSYKATSIASTRLSTRKRVSTVTESRSAIRIPLAVIMYRSHSAATGACIYMLTDNGHSGCLCLDGKTRR